MTDETKDLGADLERAESGSRVVGAGRSSPGERESSSEPGTRAQPCGPGRCARRPAQPGARDGLAGPAHYESALGALLVARSGREACPELAGILEGWDGRLTVLLRKRVGRHGAVTSAGPACRELSPVALLSVLPVAALPAALRHQVLGLIADGSPGAVGQRLAVGQRAGRSARGIPPAAQSAAAGPAAPWGALRLRAGRRRGRRRRDRRRDHRRWRTAAPSRTGRAAGYRRGLPTTGALPAAGRSGASSSAGAAPGRGPLPPGR